MTEIDRKMDTISSAERSALSVSKLPFSRNCSSFLNWVYNPIESVHKKGVVFRSLVATLKIHPALDASLEAKAVKLLKSVRPQDPSATENYLSSLASSSDDSLTNFVQCIGVLVSSTNQTITIAAMQMLARLIWNISAKRRLALVNADLIPQLIASLNQLSLSFADAVYIHISLIFTIRQTLWLTTPFGLPQLGIEDEDGQQAVHETVLTKVLIHLEKYIWHLCVYRFSIIDGSQSKSFLELLAHILQISSYYQPTMDFVHHMPVILTIPSCLAFFEDDLSIWNFLDEINNFQLEWNEEGGEVREMGKTVHRMLRMEGIEDVMEEKLQNDQNTSSGRDFVDKTIEWNNLQGINLSKQE
ncbi:hypothetical protein BLNAU_7460 [Blattamonas nauphoetae]|uniref:Uncharacterized protein n=1 Tax=Blattamonas nauphoetae TaxID=2049346 RepID=A0ABQ9Y1E8_9EUKA|nr:hypothetical protein BLNAU_7460 [Blattamonas nauphoetae]